MAERTVAVRVTAKVDGAVAGIRKVKASVDDLSKADLQKPKKAFEDLSNKAALGSVAIAVGIGKAIKSFADFDAQMSAVGAASGATGAQLDALRESALKAGADTAFSATEAAQGVTELAKAGVAAEDILTGGLDGALSLAAAGQLEVGTAAEIASSAMTQFGKSGSDVEHIADLLASGANKAQGSVGDLGAALNQTGLVANATGLSIEETTAGLAAFASAGMIGSDAGTSFKTMLQRLSAPTGEAAELMGELGINAYDANGNFVGLAAVAGQLEQGMKDLTPAQRNAAMATIFGADAVRAANVLYEEGATGIAKWTKEVDQQGAAAETAAKLLDNLNGDLEALGGSLETVFIQTGSGANDALRGLVQGATGLVNAIGRVPGPLLLAGGALATIALAAPKGISMWRNYAQQLDTLGLSMDKITKKAPRMGTALRAAQGVGAGLAIVGTFGAITGAFTELERVDLSKLESAGDAIGYINEQLAASADLGAPLKNTLGSLDELIEATFDPGKGQQIDSFFAKINSGITGGLIENNSDIEVAAQRFTQLDEALTQMVAGGNADAAKRAFDQIAAAAAAQGIDIQVLLDKFPQYRDALAGVGDTAQTTATKSGTLTDETDALEQAASNAEQALSDLQDAILGLGDPVARQRAATRDYEAAIDGIVDAIAQQRDELIQQGIAQKMSQEAAETWADQQLKNADLLDINTEAGRRNQAALDAIHDATLEKVAADFAAIESTQGVEAAQKVATETMKNGRDAFIKAAEAAGMTTDEAKALADQLGLIPENVNISVKQTGAALAAQEIDRAARNRTATITVKTVDGGTYRYSTGTPPAYGGGFQQYATGGYTGSGGKYEPAGIVHKGELVFEQEAVKFHGLDKLEALRQGNARIVPGYAGGGLVGAPYSAYRAPVASMASRGSAIDYDRLGQAVAANMPPQVSVYSGQDALTSARQAIRDWEWEARR